jgi:hypothetical protein
MTAIRCWKCDAKLADPYCPLCDAPPAEAVPTHKQREAEFAAVLAAMKTLTDAVLGDYARLAAALAKADAALASYDDDTDIHDEHGVLDRAG